MVTIAVITVIRWCSGDNSGVMTVEVITVMTVEVITVMTVAMVMMITVFTMMEKGGDNSYQQ